MRQDLIEIGEHCCTVYTNKDFTGPTLYWGVSGDNRQETALTALLLSEQMPDTIILQQTFGITFGARKLFFKKHIHA